MTPRKPIIYGPDGHPIVRARDRQAPKPRIGAGLEGWVSWGLIDRQGRVVKGGEQHNLILDGFLDHIATATNSSGSGNSSAHGLRAFDGFLTHYAVGTGSTEPDVTDTALEALLGSTTTITRGPTISRPSHGLYQILLEREFDFGVGNGNLTEFGFGAGSASNILVRELFRDNQGDPITITKTSDYKLRIAYTLEVGLSPVTLTPASFTISGIGTISGEYAWTGGSSPADTGTDLAQFSRLAGGRQLAAVLSDDTTSWAYATNINGVNTSSASRASSVSYSEYTPGDYGRSMSALWGTGNGNVAEARSLRVQGISNVSPPNRTGWMFEIDENDRFAKDNLHTLTIDDLLTVSWGRA